VFLNPAIFFLSQTQKKICKNTNKKRAFHQLPSNKSLTHFFFFVDAKEAKLFADEKSVSQSLDAFFFLLVSFKTQQLF
jgi:hypothetical protein